MIKFFRQIRFKLMNENKTSRYFKYAIGEIVLVVIGILIALQINNWNEGRKTKQQAQNYKKTIVNDLALDTVAINALIKRTKIYKKNITKYFNYIDSIKPSSSNINKLSDSLSKVDVLYMKYYPVNNSFKQMATKGNGGLLSKKQRDFLLDLLEEQEEIGIIIDNLLETARENRDKGKELSGIPNNIYEKLNATHPMGDKIKALIHNNLWLENVDDLYF